VRGWCRLVAAAILLLLAGCTSIGWPKPPPEAAASASAWMKPGLDAASVQAAYGDCREVADTATQTDFNIDQDIAASRSADLQRSDFAGSPLRDAQQSDRDRAQTILSSCMEGKGFTPAR
jgi:hypothetical protein